MPHDEYKQVEERSTCEYNPSELQVAHVIDAFPLVVVAMDCKCSMDDNVRYDCFHGRENMKCHHI